MKILVIAPTPFFADRGTHIRILEEALALEKRGHDVTIATYHIGRDVQNEVRTNINVRRIRRLIFWYKKLEAGPDWQKIILDLMLIRKVFYLARTQKPQILHGHLHEGVLIGWIVQKLLFWRGMKLVADFHGSLVKEMESHGYLGNVILKGFFGFLEKLIDNLGDFVITSSWENTRKIKKVRWDKKAKTVPDGVNIENFQNLPSKDNIRQELGLPTDKFIAVYTGALVSNKGINYLLGAIKIVLAKTDNIFFVIGGYPVEYVRKFVKENKLEENVKIIAPLSYFDLPKILAAGNIGIDPKDAEASQASGKILQYMGAGLPVVCFDKMNNREYLGGGAYYGKEYTPKVIADGVLFYLNNPEQEKMTGEQNKQGAEQFSWDLSAEKIEAVYYKAMKKKC